MSVVPWPPATTVARAAAPTLPPSEETAKQRLATSPRHGELVSVDVAGTPVKTWVVYPERKDKAPVVIVVHEIFGLTDWLRAVADQLAADGFIYYGTAPETPSGGTASILGLYGSEDARVNATIEPASEALGARYAPHVFEGAGHGFLRQQSGQEGANLRATERAWPLTLEFLRTHAK
ncbi:MAG: dienelactone hydrolase family protein [bacterium]|nr:dienelactone hydrolase family protein [bacterium]